MPTEGPDGTRPIETKRDVQALPPTPPPPPAHSPEADVSPRPEYSLEVRDDRTVISTRHEVEGIAAISRGVLFAHNNAVWRFDRGSRDLQKVTASVDPHGLASDGKWLYWFSEEENERINLDTLQREPMPRLAPSSLQHTYAVGSDVFALTLNGDIWRIRGGSKHLLLSMGTSPFGLDEIRAGGKIAVVTQTQTEPYGLIRLRGRSHEPLLGASPSDRLFSVDTRGRLLFVRDGFVQRLDPDSKTPRKVFDATGLQSICWCGREICTISADGALARHSNSARTGRRTMTPLANVPSPPHHFACNEDVVAWASRAPTQTALHLVWLDRVAPAQKRGKSAPRKRKTSNLDPFGW